MKTVTLKLDDKVFTLTSDEEGMFNLNEVYHASGGVRKNQPSNWSRSNSELIRQFDNPQIRGFKVKRGRNGGTWVIEQVVYAYAEWISPEFHAAVIEAFKAAADGDGDAAVAKFLYDPGPDLVWLILPFSVCLDALKSEHRGC